MRYYESKKYKSTNLGKKNKTKRIFRMNGQKMWVSWPAFIDFIVEKNCKSLTNLYSTCDAHYLPYSFGCQPCVQNFDAISRSETLDYEATAVIQQILPENLRTLDDGRQR